MDEQKNTLLHVPKLEPERDYLSDAEFTHKDQPLAPLPPDVDDTPAQIVEQFEELEGIMNDLPEDLQFLNLRRELTWFGRAVISLKNLR